MGGRSNFILQDPPFGQKQKDYSEYVKPTTNHTYGGPLLTFWKYLGKIWDIYISCLHIMGSGGSNLSGTSWEWVEYKCFLPPSHKTQIADAALGEGLNNRNLWTEKWAYGSWCLLWRKNHWTLNKIVFITIFNSGQTSSFHNVSTP